MVGITLVAYIARYFSRRKLIRKVEELELLQKVQKERERISRDLHDNIGSQLTYIVSNLDYISYQTGKDNQPIAQKADKLGDFARDTIGQLRQTIWSMQQESVCLKEFKQKLEDTIGRLLEDMDEPTIVFEIKGDTQRQLSPTQTLNLLRIAQEAVNNALKYAKAKTIIITMDASHESQITVSIIDDGKGFNRDKVDLEGHYGLKNMQQRAEQIKANFKLESEEGKGVQIEVML